MIRVSPAVLTFSAAALVGLISYEGYRDTAYLDTVGVPTIGIGTTEGVKLGDKITVEKALGRAVREVTVFEGAVKQCVHAPLYQYEYDVYVTFSYNIGAKNFCSSTLVKKLNALDYTGACNEILRWVKQPELKRRRALENKACLGN